MAKNQNPEMEKQNKKTAKRFWLEVGKGKKSKIARKACGGEKIEETKARQKYKKEGGTNVQRGIGGITKNLECKSGKSEICVHKK